MTDPFAAASSGFDRIQELENHLLLITPLEYLSDLKTSFGDGKDAVDADVVCLDGPNGPEKFDGMRVFPGGLVGSLKRAAKFNEQFPAGDPATGFPKMVLGRLGKGDAKRGQSAPWILTAPTEEDKQLARDWIAKLKPSDPFAA